MKVKKGNLQLVDKFLCLALFLAVQGLAAQPLEVTDAPPITPQSLITNVFLGDGVEVVSVVYQGADEAVGFFKNGEDAVGLSRGIVMTTGRAVSQGINTGVDAPGLDFASYGNSSSAVDVDLSGIANGSSVNNVCQYIITFIPIADTLRFRYAFASEEYPEWVCSNFNDIFGFFISGPGINGPYQNNAENIALIPGTNLPVRINNVNPGVVGAQGSIGNCSGDNGSLAYSQYYNNNDGSNTFPVYDGITDVFIAEAIVQPCQVYTIKLVIADVADDAFDSGVFLEAKSFGTGTLQVETSTLSLDGSLAEGCAGGSITFSLPNPVESDFPIDLVLSGTAQNGIDYEPIPANLFIPAGSNSLTVPIVGIDDGINDPDETLVFDVQRDICHRDTFTLVMKENPLVQPDLGLAQTICSGDSVQLDGTIPIVLPEPPSFSNSTPVAITPVATAVYSDVLVSGVAPAVLGPDVIQSICIDSLTHRWIDDLDIFLIGPDGQFLELTTDNGGNGGNGAQPDYYLQTCFTTGAALPINFPGPFAPPDSLPFTGEYLPEGVFSDLWDGVKKTNGTWRLLLYDDANGFEGTLFKWTLTFKSIYEINYEWSPAAGLSCTDCPNPVAKPDQTTTYTVTATDSYGCTVTDSVTIEVLPVFPAPNVQCAGPTNSSVTVVWDQIAGVDGYEVQVNGGAWETPSGNLSHEVANLVMGQTVDISVRAIGGCGGPVASLQCVAEACVPPEANISKTDISCFGAADGTVTVLPSTGTAPFSYRLDGQMNETGVFTGLNTGSYNGVVQDALGCALIFHVEISEPPVLEATAVVGEPIDCNGAANGVATVIVNGGTGPYSFEWSDASTDSLASGLPAGPAEVLVTDFNSCQAVSSVLMEEPEPLVTTSTVKDATCAGTADGWAAVSISGGVQPYEVLWDATAQNQVADTAIGLLAGLYSALVRDVNGCESAVSAQVNQPPALIAQTTATAALCADSDDGSVSVQASGGTGVLSVDWLAMPSGNPAGSTETVAGLSPGQYLVIVRDANLCETRDTATVTAPGTLAILIDTLAPACAGIGDGQAAISVSGGVSPYSIDWGAGFGNDFTRSSLSPGSYAFQVKDANGCLISDGFEFAETPAITVESSISPVTCSGRTDGQIQLTLGGGNGGFSVIWSGGQTGTSLSGLSPGTFSATITDARGCTAEGVFTVDEPAPLDLTLLTQNPLCSGSSDGQASILAGGGSGSYVIVWDNGQSGPNSTGLSAGPHSVTITDGNGCEEVRDFELTEPLELSGSIVTTLASCRPEPDGQATVSVAGGTGPYTFNWSDGQKDKTATGLAAGAYAATVTDAQGCTIILTGTVDPAPGIELTLSATPVLCNGLAQGAVSSTISGGSGNLTYEWDKPGLPAVANLTNLPAGNYTLIVTDELGCSDTATILVTEPPLLVVTTQATQVICEGDESGSIDITVGGGTGPYQFLWSNGAVTEDLTGLATGVYTLTVTDANRCLANAIATVVQPDPLRIQLAAKPVDCYGDRTGSVTALVTGGSTPYTYLWNNGINTRDLTAVPAGSYELTVTDHSGCLQTQSVLVSQPEAPLSAGVDILYVSCAGGRDGRIDLNPSGGTPPYRYSLDGIAFGGSSALIGLSTGSYPVVVRDAKGCLWQGYPAFVGEPFPLMVDLGPNRTIQYGDSLQLYPPAITGGTGTFYAYAWTPRDTALISCFDCPSPLITVDYQTSFELVVTDEAGCEASDVLAVFVRKDNPVFVPTGFTPNGDGANDRLPVHSRAGDQIQVLVFRIFDRWGELVFEAGGFTTNDIDRGWDGNFRGQPMNSGVYIWQLEVEYPDGNKGFFKGSTTLIR